MRILVLQESDWIAKGPHQSHHLMERLSNCGHQIRVIDYEIGWENIEHKELISKRQIFKGIHKAIETGDITVIRPSIIKINTLNFISLLYTHYREIQKQVSEFKPDIILGFGILNANIAIRIAQKNRIPFVYYIIDELHRLVPQKSFQGIAKYIESQNMKNADRVLSINGALRDYTIQMGADHSKTEVIRAGVDLERFCSANGMDIRKKYGIKDDDIVLFFMGWLYSFSGLKEVALQLSYYKSNIKLLILGKGDLWDDLQVIRKKYSLEDRIIIVDWVGYEEVPKYLAASDICILPAHKNEVMKNIVPIKMYEYMAAGKPVVATHLTGIEKEFGENNGVIYIERSEDTLRTVRELLENGNIAVEGNKAKCFVEKNSWSVITYQFIKILKSLVVD